MEIYVSINSLHDNLVHYPGISFLDLKLKTQVCGRHWNFNTKNKQKPDMVTHVVNSSAQELSQDDKISPRSGLHNKYKARLAFIRRPFLKTIIKTISAKNLETTQIYTMQQSTITKLRTSVRIQSNLDKS